LIKTLINNGVDVNGNYTSKTTPLIAATRCGDEEIVKILIDACAKIDSCDDDEETALLYAATYGYTDILKHLIHHGAFINHKNKDGETALIASLQETQVIDTINLLLKNNADIMITDNTGKNAIDWAESTGNKQIIDIITKQATLDKTTRSV